MSKPFYEVTWQEIELGGLLRTPGSAREYRVGDWRSQHPVWDKSRCIRCGVCWTVCPEPAIVEVRLPERCANLTFGGAKKNRLFMASSHSLYALYVEARGAV